MPRLPPGAKTLLFLVSLAAILAGGAAARVAALRRARLWTDEYIMLEIAREPTIAAVVRKVATENNPPLYPVLVHLAGRASPDAAGLLRVVSLAASLATVLLATLLALRIRGRVAALIACALVSWSAIAIHFSAEIRPYALLGLLALIQLMILRRALQSPTAALLTLLGLLQVASLLLHYYALLLLPVGPALALARRNRRSLAFQTAVSLASAAIAAPLFLPSLLRLPAEANEYILNLWHGLGPAAPAWTLFQELLPSSFWPAAPLRFGDLGPSASLAAASTALALVLALGVLAGQRRGLRLTGEILSGGALTLLVAAFLMVGLSSLVGRPVAIPGRLSSMLVAPAAIVVAASWSAAGRRRWAAAALGGIALASLAWTPVPGRPSGLDDVALAGRVLRAKANGPTLVITVGLSGLPLRHDLRDRGEIRFLDFPEDVRRHLGWWAPRAFLADPARSSREAREVALAAKAAAAEGQKVFIYGADHPAAHPLRAELIRSFRPLLLNRLCPALQELVPRPPESP